MKRFFTFAVALLFLFTCSIPAEAAQIEEIEPMFTHILTVRATLEIDQSSGMTTCTGKINAKSVQPVRVVVRLQVNQNGSWVTLNTWSSSGTATTSAVNNHAVPSGYEYRVYVVGYVYNSEGVILESGTATHTVYYPNN